MTSRLRKYFNTLPAPLRQRIRRLWLSLVPITQCALAAGTAWWVALQVFDHEQPFFAPIAAVISLGLSLSQRWRRSMELVGGVTIGILVGDLFIVEDDRQPLISLLIQRTTSPRTASRLKSH